MVTKPKKSPPKRRSASKARLRKTTKPLLVASPATVRKAKPGDRKAQPPPIIPAIRHPAFAMLDFMARIAAAYAELPSRLVQCHSPVEFWQEQTRFAQRIVDECRSANTEVGRVQAKTR